MIPRGHAKACTTERRRGAVTERGAVTLSLGACRRRAPVVHLSKPPTGSTGAEAEREARREATVRYVEMPSILTVSTRFAALVASGRSDGAMFAARRRQRGMILWESDFAIRRCVIITTVH